MFETIAALQPSEADQQQAERNPHLVMVPDQTQACPEAHSLQQSMLPICLCCMVKVAEEDHLQTAQQALRLNYHASLHAVHIPETRL